MSELPDLLLDSTESGKPIYIDGLRLNGFSGRMELRGSQPITLQNSTLSGCTECLRLEGENHKLKNVNIACGTKEEGVAGVTLIGERDEVEGVEVSNCGIGIQVGELDNSGDRITIRNSKLHDNGIGLWLANGEKNRFKKNAVYQNDWNGDGLFESEEGILAEMGSNESLRAPEVVLINEENRWALSYLEEDAEGTEGYLKIRTEEMSGNVEIYLTGEKVNAEAEEEDVGDAAASKCEESVVKTMRDSKCKQGKKFLVKAKLASVKVRAGDYEHLLHFGMNKDLEGMVAVVVFHDAHKGSSTYSQTFVLNKKEDPGILSAAELDAPAAGGDLADAGSHIMTDAIPTDSADEDDSVEGSGMGVVGPAADGGSGGGGSVGGGPEAGGPAVISGGMGGIKAGGCSLMSGNPKSLRAVNFRTVFPYILAWLSLPLFLAFWRRKKI